jgi:cobalt-zinc-cadmium efflux system outer membrane protein
MRGLALIAILICTSVMARELTLAETEELLLSNNRELQAARRAVESADAQKLIAGARPNATFSVNSSALGSNSKPDTVFRIDQPFERGNKRDLRLDAAAGLQRAAYSDSLDVQRQQLALARGAYFDLKLAQERAQVLAETAQLFSGTLDAAQRRLRAGDLAPADVAKVQVDYERSQNDARAARADVARAQLALGYLVGLEAEALQLRAADSWPAPERADAAALEQAIGARPDVIAARARVEAAEKLRDLARAPRATDSTSPTCRT